MPQSKRGCGQTHTAVTSIWPNPTSTVTSSRRCCLRGRSFFSTSVAMFIGEHDQWSCTRWNTHNIEVWDLLKGGIGDECNLLLPGLNFYWCVWANKWVIEEENGFLIRGAQHTCFFCLYLSPWWDFELSQESIGWTDLSIFFLAFFGPNKLSVWLCGSLSLTFPPVTVIPLDKSFSLSNTHTHAQLRALAVCSQKKRGLCAESVCTCRIDSFYDLSN